MEKIHAPFSKVVLALALAKSDELSEEKKNLFQLHSCTETVRRQTCLMQTPSHEAKKKD